MNQAVGAVLPLAVGVAISPIPVIGAILMLLAPRARKSSLAFLAGWVLGVLLPVVLVALLTTLIPRNGSADPKPVLAVIEIVLGVLLLVVASRQWRNRPQPGAAAPMPKWMAAIDAMTPLRGVVLGVVLSALNPKNLVMGFGAGTAIGSIGLSAAAAAVPIVIYVVVAASTVTIPVLGYLIASQRLAEPLDTIKNWLLANNTTVMVVLLIVLGVVQLGKGISNF